MDRRAWAAKVCSPRWPREGLLGVDVSHSQCQPAPVSFPPLSLKAALVVVFTLRKKKSPVALRRRSLAAVGISPEAKQCWVSSKYLKVELSTSMRSSQCDSVASMQSLVGRWPFSRPAGRAGPRAVGSGSRAGVCMSACGRPRGGWRPGLLCHQCQPSLSVANSASFQEIKQTSEFACTCEIKISFGNFTFFSLGLS